GGAWRARARRPSARTRPRPARSERECRRSSRPTIIATEEERRSRRRKREAPGRSRARIDSVKSPEAAGEGLLPALALLRGAALRLPFLRRLRLRLRGGLGLGRRRRLRGRGLRLRLRRGSGLRLRAGGLLRLLVLADGFDLRRDRTAGPLHRRLALGRAVLRLGLGSGGFPGCPLRGCGAPGARGAGPPGGARDGP